MLKEIQPIDLFDIAVQSNPPEVSGKAWGRLAGSIYGAMRRGHAALDIWEELSLELYDTLQGGSKKNKKEAEILTPHFAELVIGVNNLVAPTGEKISLEQLKLASAYPEVNGYLKPGW
jgi:hypothetical protein